jgi:hypothetical protein
MKGLTTSQGCRPGPTRKKRGETWSEVGGRKLKLLHRYETSGGHLALGVPPMGSRVVRAFQINDPVVGNLTKAWSVDTNELATRQGTFQLDFRLEVVVSVHRTLSLSSAPRRG